MKLIKGDSVKVVAGKDKGKVGKVEKVYPKDGKVLVSNVNQYKRHLKKKTQGENSQIVTLTKPLPVSNVSLICPKCNRLTRVGIRVEKAKQSLRPSGLKKIRFCKKCSKAI